MLFKTSTAVAILAVASQAAAEPQPYKPNNAPKMMSIRDMFSVVRRQSGDGYTPTQSYCGLGETCAQACGAGYETCASNDNAIHCYDPSTQQTCCPDGTGNSCDAGYYCTGASNGDTICCPNGQSLAQCAAAYKVTGSLTKETAAPTTSTSSTSMTAANTTTTSTSSSVTTHHGHNGNNTAITVFGTSFTTTSCSTSAGAMATGHNNYTTAKGGPSTTASTVTTSAAEFIKPAGAAAVLLAAAFALLL